MMIIIFGNLLFVVSYLSFFIIEVSQSQADQILYHKKKNDTGFQNSELLGYPEQYMYNMSNLG